MSKPVKPQLDDLEHQTLADLWIKVVIDADQYHPLDVDAARAKLQRPSRIDQAALEATPDWKLAAIQSLLQDNDYTARIKALFMTDAANGTGEP